MAALDFPQFLKRYNIKLLYVSDQQVVPMALVCKKRQGYDYQGHLRNYLAGPPTKWAYEPGPASIVYGTIEKETSAKGKASITEFGFQISGGLSRASSISYTLNDVRVMFPLNTDPLQLVGDINELRKSNKPAWRALNNLWVVQKTFYVSDLKVTMNVEGNANADVDFRNEVEIVGEGEVTWKNKKEFTVTNNIAVPFGFSGFKI